MTTALLIWVLAWTLIAFVLMGVDKWKARHDSWRIPETYIQQSSAAPLSVLYHFLFKTIQQLKTKEEYD